MAAVFLGGLFITLPCDREAALAVLDAAIAAARRQVALTAVMSILFLGFAFTFTALAPPGLFTPFLGLFAIFALLIPLMGYMRLQPWIRFLQRLREDIASGRVDLGSLCGRPLGPGLV